MVQPEKRRRARVWSRREKAPPSWLEELRAQERLQEFAASRTGRSLRTGLPVLLLCLFAGQGRLIGGAMPFAPALLAGAMLRDRAVPYAAAGCALGALVAREPAVLLSCALLFALYAGLRLANLRPNDLTCVLGAGAAAYLLPLLFARDLYDHVVALSGGISAAVLARMYATALRVRLRERELLSSAERISLALLFCGVVTGFRQATVFGVSPVLAALLFVSAAAGTLGGAGTGAAVGAVAGLLVGVTEPPEPYLFPGLVLAGLLPGMFRGLGRYGAAAALPVALLLAGAMDARFLTAARAVEGGLALCAFLCVRERQWAFLRGYFEGEERVRRIAAGSREEAVAAVADKLEDYAGLYARLGRAPGAGPCAAVSGALRALAGELRQPVREEADLAREIAEDLDAAGARVEGVQAERVGERLRVKLRLHCRERDGLCGKRLCRVAAAAAGAPLRARGNAVCPKKGPCEVVLEEAEAYEAISGSASLAAGEGPCGDTLTTVQLPQGRYLAALADGMGHGLGARAESRAAMDLMEDFLLARFSPEAALQAVNDLLLRSGGEETFSTMDLMWIDLTNGTLQALKIGAAPTYVRRGKRLLAISGEALPMGIVEKVRPAVTNLRLQDGDALFLLSDGVTDAVGGDEQWLARELLRADLRDPEAAAQALLEHARAVGKHEDDMTACVLRIARRHKAG